MADVNNDAVQVSIEDQTIGVDFSDVEDMSFEPLPRGRYVMRVVEAEVRQGPTAPYINVSLVVDDEDSAYNGRRVWDIISLSPKALWKLKMFLKGVGMTEEELSGGINLVPDDLLDAMVVAQLTIEKNAERGDRNKVQRYLQMVDQADLEAEVANEIADEDAAAVG